MGRERFIRGVCFWLAVGAAFVAARRASGKGAVSVNGKALLAYAVGIAGALVLGVGMCLTMVWGAGYLVPGILVGCVGLMVCILNGVLRLGKTA